MNPSLVVNLVVNLEVDLAVNLEVDLVVHEVDHVVVDLVVHDVVGLVAQEVVRNSKRLSRQLAMLWPVAGDVWCLGRRVEQPRLVFLREDFLLWKSLRPLSCQWLGLTAQSEEGPQRIEN